MPTIKRSNLYKFVNSFEGKQLKNRNFAVKIADKLTSVFGSIEFFVFNLAVFVFWLLVNTGRIPGFPPFDPYPFILLITFVSLEAIILSTIVLMSQNRQSTISTLREELQLQINLITEREITKILELLKALHEHHKIDTNDPELTEMLKAIDESYIERKLKEELTPKDESLTKALTDPVKKAVEGVEKTFSKPTPS